MSDNLPVDHTKYSRNNPPNPERPVICTSLEHWNSVTPEERLRLNIVVDESDVLSDPIFVTGRPTSLQ